MIDPKKYYESEEKTVGTEYLKELHQNEKCPECPECGECENYEQSKQCDKCDERCRKCKDYRKPIERKYLQNKLFTIVICSFACIEHAQYFDLVVQFTI